MDQPDRNERSTPKPEIDWFIFFTGCLLLMTVIVTIVVAPVWSARAIERAFVTLTESLGILYIAAAFSVFVFLMAVAVSRWGRITLGPAGGRPKYSRFSWAAMLFCTGIGSTLIYWGATEWTFYYTKPPFGFQPGSDEAILWASSYGLFHWGPVAWSLYCLPAVAFCCSYHLRKIPALRLSSACGSVLGKYSERWPGRIIDLLFVVGLVGTAATGLGFGVSLISSSATLLTGITDGFGMQVVIVAVITLLIAYSVYNGLDKGIKVLSVVNAALALAFVGFVLVAGPTRFILEMGLVALGNTAQSFARMLTWTDPLGRSDFVESWTVFYWAWWLALGPFVGLFVAKISAGRTLREVIFGMLGWGSLGCALFFTVLGNYALDLELRGAYPVVEQVAQSSPSAVIASITNLLPFGSFWLVYLAVLGAIFTATTYDSAAYTLAAGATRHLRTDEHPTRVHRVFWAVLLGVLPTVLLYLGGLRVLQTASIVASIPILLVYVLLGWSIARTLTQFSAVSAATTMPGAAVPDPEELGKQRRPSVGLG